MWYNSTNPVEDFKIMNIRVLSEISGKLIEKKLDEKKIALAILRANKRRICIIFFSYGNWLGKDLNYILYIVKNSTFTYRANNQ